MHSSTPVPVQERIRGILELIRIHNVVNAGFAALAGYIVAAGTYGGPLLSGEALLGVLIVSVAAAGGYVINDYFDLEVDRVNKPERPIPSGRVGVEEAYKLAMVLFATSVILAFTLVRVSLWVGVFCGLFVLAHAILMYYYSKTFKVMGFLGNLVVSFSSFSSLVFGGLVYAAIKGDLYYALPSIVPACYAFLIILSREIVKGIEDMEGDRVRNVKTLALKYGPRKAFLASLVPYTVLVVISPLPYFFPLLAKKYGLVYLAIALLGVDVPATLAMYRLRNDPVRYAAEARSLLKISLLMGPIAFIGGALT